MKLVLFLIAGYFTSFQIIVFLRISFLIKSPFAGTERKKIND